MVEGDGELARAHALLRSGEGEAAAALLDRMADRGHPEALFLIGDMHWRGFHFAQDLAKGRDWFRRASEAGHPMAVRAYTNLLASGIGGEADWPAAMRRLEAEARHDGRRAHMLALIEKMDLGAAGDPRTVPEGRLLIGSPEVRGFRRLFAPEECRYLMRVAEPRYEASRVFDEGGRDYHASVRTSDGATVHWLIEDPAVNALNRRIAAASGTGYDQGEPLHILRYRPGQEYRRHFDALPGLDNQRIKTALVYLDEGYSGGETAFLQAGRQVKGRTGDAIVFVNAGSDGRVDKMSEHAGLPVIHGIKHIASRWIRARRHLP